MCIIYISSHFPFQESSTYSFLLEGPTNQEAPGHAQLLFFVPFSFINGIGMAMANPHPHVHPHTQPNSPPIPSPHHPPLTHPHGRKTHRNTLPTGDKPTQKGKDRLKMKALNSHMQ